MNLILIVAIVVTLLAAGTVILFRKALLGAILEYLITFDIFCMKVVDEVAYRLDKGSLFNDFIYISRQKNFQAEIAQENGEIKKWEIVETDDLPALVPRCIEKSQWRMYIFKNYGIVFFQDWSFAKRIHTYPFQRSEWELDTESNLYKIISFKKGTEGAVASGYYTKTFTMAFFLTDAEDKYGVPTKVQFTLYLSCTNPYIASVIQDDWPEALQQIVISAAAEFVGRHTLLLLAMKDSVSDVLDDEILERAAQSRKSMREQFSKFMQDLSDTDLSKFVSDDTEGDVRGGLKSFIGFKIYRANIIQVEAGGDEQVQQRILQAMLKWFEAGMSKLAAKTEVEEIRMRARAKAYDFRKKIRALTDKVGPAGLLYFKWNQMPETKLTTYVEGEDKVMLSLENSN